MTLERILTVEEVAVPAFDPRRSAFGPRGETTPDAARFRELYVEGQKFRYPKGFRRIPFEAFKAPGVRLELTTNGSTVRSDDSVAGEGTARKPILIRHFASRRIRSFTDDSRPLTDKVRTTTPVEP
jgi:hypothetical protein